MCPFEISAHTGRLGADDAMSVISRDVETQKTLSGLKAPDPLQASRGWVEGERALRASIGGLPQRSHAQDPHSAWIDVP
jgi:hypothetical protein